MKSVFVVVAQSAQAIGDSGGHCIIGVYWTRETAEAVKKMWLDEHEFACVVECMLSQYEMNQHCEMAKKKAAEAMYVDIGIVYTEDDGVQFLFDALFK